MVKVYPTRLFVPLTISTESESVNLNVFFNTNILKINKQYPVVIWVKQDDSLPNSSLIPRGEIIEIGLLKGSNVLLSKNIEGVFDFEFNEVDMYVKEEKIMSWLNKKKNN